MAEMKQAGMWMQGHGIDMVVLSEGGGRKWGGWGEGWGGRVGDSE